ncbi:hypothetical protein D3C72_967710 [compost metagenome]
MTRRVNRCLRRVLCRKLNRRASTMRLLSLRTFHNLPLHSNMRNHSSPLLRHRNMHNRSSQSLYHRNMRSRSSPLLHHRNTRNHSSPLLHHRNMHNRSNLSYSRRKA